MQLTKLFRRQLVESYAIAPLYYLEMEDRLFCRSIPFWKLGSLIETHEHMTKLQKEYILPVFKKKKPLSKRNDVVKR